MHLKKQLKVALIAALTVVGLASCDNKHDDEPAVKPSPVTYTGKIISAIPAVPNFEPSISNSKVTVEWVDDECTHVNLFVGGFTVTITQIGREIVIGDMEIKNVAVQGSAAPSSKPVWNDFTIPETEFECQAGEYATKGSISGHASNQSIEVELVYRPGSMPFDVESKFVGEAIMTAEAK